MKIKLVSDMDVAVAFYPNVPGLTRIAPFRDIDGAEISIRGS